jgi:hypothetical protein
MRCHNNNPVTVRFRSDILLHTNQSEARRSSLFDSLPQTNQTYEQFQAATSMPKTARIPRHRGVEVKKGPTKNAEKVAENESTETSNADVQQQLLSRGQRKRQAKHDQFLKREKMIMTSLKIKRADEQRQQIDGLDEIRDALLATVAGIEKPKEEGDALPKDNMLKSNKSRQRLLQQEAAQMNLVLQHPSYQADPFSTLKEHLQNTMAGEVKYQQSEAIKHAKEKVTKQIEKVAFKKESGAKRKRKKFKATRTKSR